MEQKRDFKGVWIPKTVWLDKRLSALDKMILTEIDSLASEERGCFASNAYIADFCQCSEAKVTKSISLLIKLGYLYVASFNGRQRELKSHLSTPSYEAESENVQGSLVKNTRQGSKFYEAESENLRDSKLESKLDNNIFNNNSQKENTQKKKFSSDDSDAPPDVSPASGTDARPKKEEKVFDKDSDAYQAAAYLARQIEKNYPNVTPPTEKDKQRWAADFDKCNRINKRSWDDIADVLHFSQRSPFWRKNILSGKKFREKYDRLLIEMTEENKKNGK
nr:MAG TPA: replication protein O [Caudoviricetes sp.]